MKRYSLLVAFAVLALWILNACGASMDASKSRADAQIQSGNIPPAEELRVAEYLNYYKQDFPAPVNTTLGLDTRLGNSQVPSSGGEAWLQIGLRARDAASEAIAPLNLALVIDRSGSMDTSDKMPYLKQSLRVFLHSLAPNDLVAIVTYSDNASVLVSTRPVGDGQWIDGAVEQIRPGGSTNLYDGMVQGFQQVERNFVGTRFSASTASIENPRSMRRNNRVILLTDGIANQGVTNPDQIAQTAKQYNDRGIYLSTIGLGQEYNDALLSQLARQGKGGYHFVGSAADMDKIFRQEVSGLMQKAASDVSVTLRPAQGVRVAQITGYEGAPPYGNVTIKLQDMGTGDTQVVLARLQLEPGAYGLRSLADVELRYRDLFSQRAESIARNVSADANAFGNYDALSDVQVLRNVTIQRTAEGMKEIARLYQQRRYQEAWQLAVQLEQQLRYVAQLTHEDQMYKDADTLRRYQDTLARWVQSQTGRPPEYAYPTESTGSRLDRLPTFTPPPSQIEIK
ncbi:MAG: VWA domain-containing protein [Chloroflexi bacterium]|nr:VWA domain-containing protein [Chloroflexota bacterium]